MFPGRPSRCKDLIPLGPAAAADGAGDVREEHHGRRVGVDLKIVHCSPLTHIKQMSIEHCLAQPRECDHYYYYCYSS